MSFWFGGYNGFAYTNTIVDPVLYRSDRVKNYKDSFNAFGRYATKPIELDLSSQTMNNVEIMEEMFRYIGQGAPGGTINLKGLRFPKNKTLYSTFGYAFEHGTGDITLDITDWDVSQVKRFGYMFEGFANYLYGDIDLRIDNDWDLSGVEQTDNYGDGLHGFMRQFASNAKYNTIKLDLSKWNVSKVKNFTNAFYFFAASEYADEDAFLELNASNWDLNNATEFGEIFHDFGYRSRGIVRLIANNWDLSRSTVDSFSGSFCYIGEYSKKTYIEMKNWDARNVTNMSRAFNNNGAYSKDIEMILTGWNASSVTNMYSAFGYVTNYSPNANVIININDWILNENNIEASTLFAGIMVNEGPKVIYANTLDFKSLANTSYIFSGVGGYTPFDPDFKIYVKDEANQDFIMSLSTSVRPAEFEKNKHILVYNGEAD